MIRAQRRVDTGGCGPCAALCETDFVFNFRRSLLFTKSQTQRTSNTRQEVQTEIQKLEPNYGFKF